MHKFAYAWEFKERIKNSKNKEKERNNTKELKKESTKEKKRKE